MLARSYRSLGLSIENRGPIHVDVDRQPLAGTADVVRLQFRHHRRAGEAEGRIAARAGRLQQVYRRVVAERALRRRRAVRARQMFRPLPSSPAFSVLRA